MLHLSLGSRGPGVEAHHACPLLVDRTGAVLSGQRLEESPLRVAVLLPFPALHTGGQPAFQGLLAIAVAECDAPDQGLCLRAGVKLLQELAHRPQVNQGGVMMMVRGQGRGSCQAA